MPVLPAAAKLKMYFAPLLNCASASSLDVAGSLNELPKPSSSFTFGLTDLTPSWKPTSQRRMNGWSIAPTAPMASDFGNGGEVAGAGGPKKGPGRGVAPGSWEKGARAIGGFAVPGGARGPLLSGWGLPGVVLAPTP